MALWRYQLTYDENDRLVQKIFNNDDGENILRYIYDENGVLTNIDWTCDREPFHKDEFVYTYHYNPEA